MRNCWRWVQDGPRSAAALWKLRRWPLVPEISSAVQHRIAGINAHRTVALMRSEVTTQRGIRVTTPARTIQDIAPRLTDAQLVRAIHEARRSGILIDDEAKKLVAAYPRAARLVDLGEPPSESALEDLFREFLRRFKLPRPTFQAIWHGHRVDAIYADELLIIELDGRRDHQQWDRIEADHIRDALALERGVVTLRITERMLRTEPRRLAAQLRAILAARRPVA